MGNCECNETAASSKHGEDWVIPKDFDELVLCCQRDLRAFCNGLLSDHEKARDATQETFLWAWNNKHKYDPAKVGGKIKVWLRITARNVCIEIWRKDHPIVVAFRSPDRAITPAGQPFLFPILLTPPVAVCTALDLPAWLDLTPKNREKLLAPQALEGTPAEVGEWTSALRASFRGAVASQEFRLKVVDPKTAATADQSKNKVSPESKTRAHHDEMDDSNEPTTGSTEHPAAKSHDVEWLLSLLSKRDAKVVRLHYYDDLSTEEIAKAMSLTQVNVKAILMRARIIMRGGYDDDLPPENDDRP